MENVSKQNRDVALDVFKGFAILIVVVGHALQALSMSGLAYQLIRSFQMELFMFTSGLAFSYSYPSKANSATAKKLLTRLLPVYLIWSYILFFLTSLVSTEKITAISIMKVLYSSGFWYLRYLLLYELFILFIGTVIRRIPIISEKKWIYYVAPLFGVAFIWLGTLVPILNSSMSSPLYLYLVLGCCFGAVKQHVGEKLRIVIAVGGLFGVILLLALKLLNIFVPIFAIAFFWGLSTQVVKFSRTACVFSYLGLRTLQIYAIHVCLLHGPWIATNWYQMICERINMPFAIGVVLLSVLWLGICLLATWLISKSTKLSHILFAR